MHFYRVSGFADREVTGLAVRVADGARECVWRRCFVTASAAVALAVGAASSATAQIQTVAAQIPQAAIATGGSPGDITWRLICPSEPAGVLIFKTPSGYLLPAGPHVLSLADCSGEWANWEVVIGDGYPKLKKLGQSQPLPPVLPTPPTQPGPAAGTPGLNPR